MNDRHLPVLGPRFWTALCFASVFGANLGDFFAHDLGLGHVKGLPFLALAFVCIVVAERFDRRIHEGWYWAAIVVIRTAATNLADLLSGDLQVPRAWSMPALGLALALVVGLAWSAWRRSGGQSTSGRSTPGRKSPVLSADAPYWVCMLLAGTLGTVLGDYVSHNLHLGDARASIALAIPLALLFALGGRGRLGGPAFYWAAVVMVRAAGTAVGDFFAQRAVLGLAASTAVTGLAFVALLLVQAARPVRAAPTGD
jgi:uncharacterized membrane-anchored protein